MYLLYDWRCLWHWLYIIFKDLRNLRTLDLASTYFDSCISSRFSADRLDYSVIPGSCNRTHPGKLLGPNWIRSTVNWQDVSNPTQAWHIVCRQSEQLPMGNIRGNKRPIWQNHPNKNSSNNNNNDVATGDDDNEERIKWPHWYCPPYWIHSLDWKLCI